MDKKNEKSHIELAEDKRTHYRVDFSFSIGILTNKLNELEEKERQLNVNAMTVYWLFEIEELKKAIAILKGEINNEALSQMRSELSAFFETDYKNKDNDEWLADANQIIKKIIQYYIK